MKLHLCMAMLLTGSLLLVACNDSAGTSGATSANVTPRATSSSNFLPSLRAEGTKILDEYGREVYLRGVNYSHRTKTRPYTSWQDESHFARIRELGFNSVRYLVLWDGIEPTEGVYDRDYLASIERALRWCENQGLYVILDMHQDLWGAVFGGDGAPAWASVDDLVEPNELLQPWFLTYFTREVQASFDRFWSDVALQQKFIDAWREVVRLARSSPVVVGYDIINEPSAGSAVVADLESTLLSDFYTRVITQLQVEDPESIYFFEPVAFGGNLPSFLRDLDLPNTAYLPHYYDVLIGMGLPYDGGSWRADLAFSMMDAQADGWGVPWGVGEFGVRLDVEGALAALEDQMRLLEERRVQILLYWNFNPEPEVNSTLEEEVMSLVLPDLTETPPCGIFARPFAEFVAGELLSLSFEPASRVFAATISNAGYTGGAPTQIRVLASRHYPNGFEVFIEDAAYGAAYSYDSARDIILVEVPPQSTPFRIRITPAD